LDGIDRLYGNRLANLVRQKRGDAIYHCLFCRLQFYDHPAADVRAVPPVPDAAPKPKEPAPAELEKASAAVLPPEPVPQATPALPARVRAGSRLTAGISVRGSIHSAEDLYVDCDVDGTLNLPRHRITLGPNAKIKANVRAGEIEVQGLLRGDLDVQNRTVLRKGSMVTGDIKTADIVIEDGAHFKGSVDLIPPPAGTPAGVNQSAPALPGLTFARKSGWKGLEGATTHVQGRSTD
jgi:cytoskeletal protein CcmA (bactofilin family)